MVYFPNIRNSFEACKEAAVLAYNTVGLKLRSLDGRTINKVVDGCFVGSLCLYAHLIISELAVKETFDHLLSNLKYRQISVAEILRNYECNNDQLKEAILLKMDITPLIEKLDRDVSILVAVAVTATIVCFHILSNKVTQKQKSSPAAN